MLEDYPVISYDSHLFELNVHLSFSEGKCDCFVHYLNFMLKSETYICWIFGSEGVAFTCK
jgi:hypothetical protein